MLITFEGEGCHNCPFRIWVESYSNECSLSKLTDATGIKLPDLAPDDAKKPDGCPFKEYPHNIEIQHMVVREI